MTPANLVSSIGSILASTYFYVFLIVQSDLSISSASYIGMTMSLVAQFSDLVYGAVVVRFPRVKWFMVVGLALQLLGRGVQYALPDPDPQMGGLIASQVLVGLGTGIEIHYITAMQAVVAVKGQSTKSSLRLH